MPLSILIRQESFVREKKQSIIQRDCISFISREKRFEAIPVQKLLLKEKRAKVDKKLSSYLFVEILQEFKGKLRQNSSK